jgi:hypothetical protein
MTVQDKASRAMLDLHEITIEWQKKEWLGERVLHELHCHIGAIQRIFDMAIPATPTLAAASPGRILDRPS